MAAGRCPYHVSVVSGTVTVVGNRVRLLAKVDLVEDVVHSEDALAVEVGVLRMVEP